MLQKSFFITEALPYKENPVLSLSGGESFEENTIFVPGIYLIDVQAGAGIGYNGRDIGRPARISQTIEIREHFIVRAYCGGSGTSTNAGSNPYSGAFKVNAYMSESNVPSVSHIFGNSGTTYFGETRIDVTSGNCLGDGARDQYTGASGAGSCLHLLPENGVFGTDYLFAFHTTAGASSGVNGGMRRAAGVGSAYGGAGSGTASRQILVGSTYIRSHSYNAGSTPYGVGGAGVPAPNTDTVVLGNNGTGIGYGYGGGVSLNGVGAWFNGSEWLDSRVVGDNSGGHIIITFVSQF